MKFLMMIYTDDALLAELPREEFDARMRSCLAHADDLRRQGRLLDTQMLAPATSAKAVREREGKVSVRDGPFAETKELLAGFNVIEASSMDEAVRMAEAFPWTTTGAIELRPIIEVEGVRRQVGA